MNVGMMGLTGAVMESGFVPDMRKRMPIDRLLEWAYRQQRADMVVGMGAGLERDEAAVDGVISGRTSACGCAAVARIAELGCRVDMAGGPAGHLHVDAERIHERVSKLSRPISMLLIRHARVGSVPDTHVGVVVVGRPSLNRRGRPLVQYASWDKDHNYGWCPVEWSISIARIEAARMEYRLWWDALALLGRELRGQTLSAHRAEPPSVAREPWARTAIS